MLGLLQASQTVRRTNAGSGIKTTRSALSDYGTNSWRTDDAKLEIPLAATQASAYDLTLYRQEIGDEIIRSCTSKGLEVIAGLLAQHARESYQNTESLICLHPRRPTTRYSSVIPASN